MAVRVRPGVLMVTGAYFPELSGAGLQCRTLMRSLRDEVDFRVLTMTADRSLPADDREDGIPVYRVFIEPANFWSNAVAAVHLTVAFLRSCRHVSIVHFHGFSRKSILLILLALVARKRIAIKLTSVGHDDPVSMRRRGRLAYWCFARASLFFAVSPPFQDSYRATGLPAKQLLLIPNGVDVERFRPAIPGEREVLARELSIPDGRAVVLFVGFFSREKRPDLLFRAWASWARALAPASILLYVGATRSSYYEVDAKLAETIRRDAAALDLASQVRFVETAHEIERFYRAADVFVLPSVREGLPNALLEAMASGLPCIATRLEGVTDVLIADGENGLLVPRDDAAALEAGLASLVGDPGFAASLGRAARRTIEKRYGLDRVARQYLNAYSRLLGAASMTDSMKGIPI